MATTDLTPVMRPYDPATLPAPTPEQRERLARAQQAAGSRYASDGVRNPQPALAAAAVVAGIAAPEVLAPLGLAAGEAGEGAAAGLAGRAFGGALQSAGRAVAGFVGQAARAFLDSSGAAARSAAGTLADPARLGEAAAQFTRSAFVDKAKETIVIGAAGELAHRALGALHERIGHPHPAADATDAQAGSAAAR